MNMEFDWGFELTGFGGDYEKECRNMVKTGVKWLRSHPNAVEEWSEAARKFKQEHPNMRHVPGHIYPKSRDEFENAIVKVCPECTGAMLAVATKHARLIFCLGWNGYCRKVEDGNKKSN